MLKFDCKIEGIDELKKMLSPDRLKKVVLSTISETARLDVKSDLQKEMKQIFDRPTQAILNGIYTRLSMKEIAVEIGFKDYFMSGIGIDTVLTPHVEGGTRPMKRSERHLNRYYVPGSGAKIDRYGNIPGSEIMKILSTVKALPEVGFWGNLTKGTKAKQIKRGKFRNIFMIKGEKNLAPGIYEKTGKGRIKALLVFVRTVPTYSIRFHFKAIVADSFMRYVHSRFKDNFDRAFRS